MAEFSGGIIHMICLVSARWITPPVLMSGRVSNDTLSEVIGFILIIGLLVVVLSLYITYIVPSEGRTNEIEQTG